MLYYGDEIGLGENIYLGDRNGVRTPMQWSSDKNAGFSRANPQSLYLPIILDPGYHYEAVNVEAQLANPHSLLWWMRRLLALRKRWRALGEGKCEFLQPDNHKILSYILRHEQETILVVANLSRFAQPVELDLSAFKTHGARRTVWPDEISRHHGRAVFSDARPAQFLLVFARTQTATAVGQPAAGAPARLPSLAVGVTADWQEIFTGEPSRDQVRGHPAGLPQVPAVVFRQDQNHQTAPRSRRSFSVPLPDETDRRAGVSPG